MIGIAVAIAYWLVQRNPGTADTLLFGKNVLLGIAGLAFALILIATGSPVLMFVGALGIFFGALYLFREQPYEGAI